MSELSWSEGSSSVKSLFELWQKTTRSAPPVGSAEAVDHSLTLLGIACCAYTVLGTTNDCFSLFSPLAQRLSIVVFVDTEALRERFANDIMATAWKCIYPNPDLSAQKLAFLCQYIALGKRLEPETLQKLRVQALKKFPEGRRGNLLQVLDAELCFFPRVVGRAVTVASHWIDVRQSNYLIFNLHNIKEVSKHTSSETSRKRVKTRTNLQKHCQCD